MLSLLQEQLKKIVLEIIQNKYGIHLSEDKIKIETPPDKKLGDFAVPAGFLLAKELKKKPFDIVEELAQELNKNPLITHASAAMPGFLNFFLSPQFFEQWGKKVLLEKEALDFKPQEEKIIMEYVSANPTGPLHIGHGRWAALGDSIVRLLKKIGYTVYQEFYVNDAGNQIENLYKTVEALRNNLPIPEDGYHGAYVKECLGSDLPPHLFFLEQQKQVLKNFRVVFDNYYSEKSLRQSDAIQNAIQKLREKNYIYEKEGAIWFASTQFGDDKDRVLIKSDGSYTYFAPDIAYHLTKIERGFHWIIDILGADHHGYVPRLKAAVLALSEKKVKIDILIGQLVSLFRAGEPVRMSKRTGDMITLQEVMEEIGVDALRYILVSKKHTQTIDFDLEEVKQKTKDNPVFYIQYAFARIQSIFRNIQEKIDYSTITLPSLEDAEKQLFLLLIRFKDEVFSAAKNIDPSHLSNYLLDLATTFHHFYEKCRVLDQGKIIPHRVFIIELTAKILKEGLFLLGIESPDKM